MPLLDEPAVIAPSFQIDPIDTLLPIVTPSAPVGAMLPVEVIDRLAPAAIAWVVVLAEAPSGRTYRRVLNADFPQRCPHAGVLSGVDSLWPAASIPRATASGRRHAKA
jgi:hypothetical protein